ncbi:DUF2247 family protein [Pseudoalteromonas aurantia]|uniref:DUF2247 domain-containing protein n=1 Tax=Pseudoalteromonas aurantia 208 TaxID=1314867 RepID=A0ABR9E9L9_9GAMM|nr:DUF2247 family protein [Pseudoalteromonas aurantia]MBE0367039.1 hypothetical protein [Pseudoalteromonas aurantia 208]
MGYLVTLPTYEFAVRLASYSWGELLSAVERQIVSRQFVIEHAMAELIVMEKYPDALLELASLNKGDDIHPYIDDLVENEVSVSDVDEKVLFLVLSWLFETKELYDEPLAIVEEIYADFDYPECISGFIRYMPSEEPSLGTVEENKLRLIGKWESYIDEKYREYNS